MKSFIAATIAASASARVHEFAAEAHLICELCQNAVEYEKNNEHEQLDKLYELFPKLEERIQTFKDEITSIVNLQDPIGTCQRLNLCESYDLIEMIEDNSFIDFAAIAEQVNARGASWTATESTRFSDKTIGELKKTMGTIVDPEWTVKTGGTKTWSGVGAPPASFDARTQWPECYDVINNIRDQSDCGSCWAFGTTEAFNDRMCINSIANQTSTGGLFMKYLSTADTTGCCNGKECFSFGCNGGQVNLPWGWFVRTGVVTGGGMGTGDFCYDYTMPMCAHHVVSPPLEDCSLVPTVDPTCESTCVSNPNIQYSDDKILAFDSYGYSSSNTVQAIMEDILEYGPVTAAFTVYADFETYTGGVYVYDPNTSGAALGGHAIKVIGWGTETNSGLDYWLCNNSWNAAWGVSGTFMIQRGDCGIDNQMHAGRVPITQ